MNLRQIEVFRAVMQAGSVTGAAAVLHVSQPGISRMLAHIERQLGLALFERSRGRLRPTPEAQALQAQIEQVYAGVRRIEDFARALQGGGGLTLRVLTSPSLGLDVVPDALAGTAQAHAQARFEVESLPVRDMAARLAGGQADLGISSLAVEHPLLRSSSLGHWGLRCAMPQVHALAARRSLGPRDILQQPLVAFPPETPQGQALAAWSASCGLPVQARFTVRSGQMACALAARGAGIAVVDTLTAAAWQGDGLVFRAIRGAPTFTVHALQPAHAPASALARDLLSRVRCALGAAG